MYGKERNVRHLVGQPERGCLEHVAGDGAIYIICFDVSVRRIAHVEDDYFVETGGHSANSGVNAIVRHEVLRRHSVGIVPNLGRYRMRSSILVSQLQV